MHLAIGNRPSGGADEVRYFQFLGGTNQGADNEDLGPVRAPDREPGTREDGEASPPGTADPKDPEHGIDPPTRPPKVDEPKDPKDPPPTIPEKEPKEPSGN
jgi:hypothetical protein